MKEPILSTDSYGKSQVVYDRDVPKNIRYQWALFEINRLRSQIPHAQKEKIDAIIAWKVDPTREHIGGLSATAWEKKYVSGQLRQILNKIDVLIKYADQNE